jgi:hypothetical protein
VLISGCVLPLPEHSIGNEPYYGYEEIKKLVVGKTTRADVLLEIGTPAIRAEDDRIFVYQWVVIVGWWGIGYGAAGDIRKGRQLCLEFGDQGLLVGKQVMRPWILGSEGRCDAFGVPRS